MKIILEHWYYVTWGYEKRIKAKCLKVGNEESIMKLHLASIEFPGNVDIFIDNSDITEETTEPSSYCFLNIIDKFKKLCGKKLYENFFGKI